MLKALIISTTGLILAACGSSSDLDRPPTLTTDAEVSTWLHGCYENPKSCTGDIVYEGARFYDHRDPSVSVYRFDPRPKSDELYWQEYAKFIGVLRVTPVKQPA